MGRSWVHRLATTSASIAMLAGCNSGDLAGFGSSGLGSSLAVNIEPITTRFIQV